MAGKNVFSKKNNIAAQYTNMDVSKAIKHAISESFNHIADVSID
jgi:predicted metal-dependent RNase